MRLDIYVHDGESNSVLSRIEAKVTEILKNLGVMMAKVDELKAELVEINSTTNEIASDIDDLIARLANGLTPAEAEEVKAELTALKSRLTGIAAVHTPVVP